jgi:hypothetical protein
MAPRAGTTLHLDLRIGSDKLLLIGRCECLMLGARGVPLGSHSGPITQVTARGIHFQRFLIPSEDLILDPLEIPPVAYGAVIV